MAADGDIREKLVKLEALFARGATAGERAAAGAARDRLQAKLAFAAEQEPETELQYTFPDTWSVRIFVALCRKHGTRPFRYPRQRRTTVMVRVRQVEFEARVWKEFQTLHRELSRYFDETVEHLIADSMKSNGDDDGLEQRCLPV